MNEEKHIEPQSGTKLVILASSSPYRLRLLKRIGLNVVAISPPYKEVEIPGLSPLELIKHRSIEKSRSVAKLHPNAWIIGSDQGLTFENVLLGKGHSWEGSFTQLSVLSGKEAVLATGLCVLGPNTERYELNVQELKFRELSPTLISQYVDFDQPLDCAGSFKIESAGPVLFEYIRGDDPSAIEGLPLMRLTSILLELGISFLR
ncbi:MAG: Maf family protein [Bradymonadia bacterium]|jgi:septum formation protein